MQIAIIKMQPVKTDCILSITAWKKNPWLLRRLSSPLDSSPLYRCQRIRQGWCGCGNRLAEKERQNRRPFHISGRFYMGKHLKAEILLVANFLLNIR